MERAVRIELGEPVIIGQAPPEIRDWGPYQFPSVGILPDGRLHCVYHIVEDTQRGYGKEGGHAVSEDGGKTWQESEPVYAGLLLPNGDRIRPANRAAQPVAQEDLPEEKFCETILSGRRIPLFDPALFGPDHTTMYYMRMKAGTTEWVEEKAEGLLIPKEAAYCVFGVVPYPSVTRFRLSPDGTLYLLNYPFSMQNPKGMMTASVFASKDCGYHWEFVVSFPYEDDLSDPDYMYRTGTQEPDMTFLPDGSMMLVYRTDDVKRGPTYVSYSNDGKEWTKPVRFDDRGVLPNLLTLKNGVTLATYGRYGFFIRATADPSGRAWDERIEIVPPVKPGEKANTCSYSSMTALSDDTAYLVYSDFTVPNGDGVPCKTILGRTVKAVIV